MRLRYKYLLFLCGLLLALAANTHSSVISGIGVLDLGGWDFSETTSVHPDDADIFWAIVVDPPLGLVVATNYALVAEIPDSTFEDLKYAPEDTSMYGTWAPAVLERCYVVRTREAHYAKFKFLQLPYLVTIIEYVYQPDGSRKLVDTVPVERHTWGRIKSLYGKDW